MKPIFFSANPKSPASGYWDQALLTDILSMPAIKNLKDNGGAIVVIPAPYQGDHIADINKMLDQYKWVLLFLTSDEEGRFPIEKIEHPNIKIWVQYPKQGRHDKYGKLPLGYTSDTRKWLIYTEKTLNVFFSGQITHKRRQDMWKHLIDAVAMQESHHVLQTDGFAKGIHPDVYMADMNNAKVAPAPAGPVSADSFRAYEALEAGAVPIADQISQAGDHDYFNYIFGSVPFATINDYVDLPGYIKDILAKYPAMNNEVQAWWIKKKHDLMWQFVSEIENLSGCKHSERVSAIIPVSPIKSHPSVKILEETIKSIRYHLPEAEIIITFDGVRAEQEHMRKNYEEFTRRALYLCNTQWNATPIIFKEHTHQVGMARVALESVHTPVILYCEQDTPLVTDEPIAWDHLIASLTLCEANVIRFHFEAKIPKAHAHLMIGEAEGDLLRTIQWSQRPHLASTDFYKYILREKFSKNAKCFIEDKIHGDVQRDYADMGFRGWDLWKLYIYYPDAKNIKRSLNLDGREGAEKYDGTQTF